MEKSRVCHIFGKHQRGSLLSLASVVDRAAAGAWLALLAASVGVGQQCRSVERSVSVRSSNNATGHWKMDVRLQHRSPVPGRGAAPDVQLEVKPNISICGVVRYDSITVTLNGPPPPQGPGYVVVPGVGYYRIQLGAFIWEEAKVACEAENAHLLVIETAAEDKAIQDLLKAQRNLPTWLFIGFHDKEREGNYVTIFGDPVSSLGSHRWQPGQPDNHQGNENCGTLWSNPPTGGLNDHKCELKTGFICEQRVA